MMHRVSFQLPLASTIPEDYSSDDTLLLENVLCGTFQEAQRVTRDSYLPSPEETEGPEGQKSCFDPLLGEPNAGGRASEAEARESPVAVHRTESPRPSRQTFGYSSVDSPRVNSKLPLSTVHPTSLTFCRRSNF